MRDIDLDVIISADLNIYMISKNYLRIIYNFFLVLNHFLKGVKFMRYEIEKRLHRVKITLDRNGINCPNARCNNFYKKCTLFRDRKLSELYAY